MARYGNPRHGRSRHGRSQAGPEAGRGWSLIELLLASALLLVALLASAPLFMRAVRDVRTGAARSAAALLAQNGLEASSAPSGAPPGAASSPEYYSFERRRWLAEPPAPPDRALWVRETTQRRYPLSAVADGELEPGEAEPGDGCRPPDAPRICLISIEVEVSRRAGGRPVARLERLEWATD